MQKFSKKLVIVLILSIITTLTITPVSAATNSATGTTSEKLSKIQTVKTGTTKVLVKSFPKGYDISTWSRVKYKAPKTGTYTFTFSDLSSSKLDKGVATFSIQQVSPYGVEYGFNNCELKDTTGDQFRLFEEKELTKALTKHYIDYYSEGYENPEQCVIDKLKDCNDSLKESDTYSKTSIKIKLKKGQVVYLVARSAGEMNIKLGCKNINKPFTYMLKISKPK